MLNSSSLLAAFLLAASLSLYSYLSLALRRAKGGSSVANGASVVYGVEMALPWLRHGCVIVLTISGLALVQDGWGLAWGPASALAVALLVALGAIDRLALAVATGKPAWADRCSRPLLWAVARLPTGQGVAADLGLPNDHITNAPPPGDTLPTLEELAGLDQRDRRMLRSILRLDETTARGIMAPRLNTVAVASDSTPEAVVQLMIESGHNRLPVYERTLDHIVGVVHLRDLLAQRQRNLALPELWRPAFFIPESKRLDELLEELQERGQQMAIVVDEYGGTAGVITLKDLLEELVGDMGDEDSRIHEPQAVRLPDGAVLADARVALEDVAELLDSRISGLDADTVGGYVYRSLDRIPQVGDVVVMDHLSIEVVSVAGPRLLKLRVSSTDGNPAGANGSRRGDTAGPTDAPAG